MKIDNIRCTAADSSTMSYMPPEQMDREYSAVELNSVCSVHVCHEHFLSHWNCDLLDLELLSFS
jgi:hypothetical protein